MAEKWFRLLTQIKNHGHARFLYDADFLPPCEDSKGNKYDHMDKHNPLKCMFAHSSACGHDWGGLCPGHEKLFCAALKDAPNPEPRSQDPVHKRGSKVT